MFAVAANNVPSGLVDLFHGIQVIICAQYCYVCTTTLTISSRLLSFISTGRRNVGVDDQHFAVCVVEGQLIAIGYVVPFLSSSTWACFGVTSHFYLSVPTLPSRLERFPTLSMASLRPWWNSAKQRRASQRGSIGRDTALVTCS
jgi:hypothetical protein